MDLIAVLRPILFVGFGGIALGSLINYRRVRTGLPPSWVGSALQVISIGVVVLSVTGALLAVAVISGAWPLALLGLAIGAVVIFGLAGTMHATRTRPR